MKKLQFVALCFILLGIAGCEAPSSNDHAEGPTNTPSVQAGGVYATKDDDGKYSISKVLACDEFAVHLRFYNEKFDSIPTEIDTTKLTYFIGHAPLAVEGFLKDSPSLIAVEPVQDEELEGYRLYLDAMNQQ